MDLDAQYSHDIEQAIAVSKESAKEEMDESQAIAESKALAAENGVDEPRIADAIMAQSDEDVEILEGLPSKGSAKKQMEPCKAIEEPQALSAGNSPAELERPVLLLLQRCFIHLFPRVKHHGLHGKTRIPCCRLRFETIVAHACIGRSSRRTLRPSSRAAASVGNPRPNDELSVPPGYVTISPRNTRQMGFLPDAPTTSKQMNGLPRPVVIPRLSPAPMLANPEEVERLHELAVANHDMHEPQHPFREKPSRRRDYHSPMYIRDEDDYLYVDTYDDDEVTGRRRYAPAEYPNKRRLPGDEGFVWTNDADNRLRQERELMDFEEAEGRGSKAVKEARECAMQ